MITQTSLAKKVGCSVSTINEYEAGADRRPKPPLAAKFSRVIGGSVDWWAFKATPKQISDRIRAFRLRQRGV